MNLGLNLNKEHENSRNLSTAQKVCRKKKRMKETINWNYDLLFVPKSNVWKKKTLHE